jgi:hypothetical protein
MSQHTFPQAQRQAAVRPAAAGAGVLAASPPAASMRSAKENMHHRQQRRLPIPNLPQHTNNATRPPPPAHLWPACAWRQRTFIKDSVPSQTSAAHTQCNAYSLLPPTCGQHAHDKGEHAAGGGQAPVEEDASQEGAEEAVDDGVGEALSLQATSTRPIGCLLRSMAQPITMHSCCSGDPLPALAYSAAATAQPTPAAHPPAHRPSGAAGWWSLAVATGPQGCPADCAGETAPLAACPRGCRWGCPASRCRRQSACKQHGMPTCAAGWAAMCHHPTPHQPGVTAQHNTTQNGKGRPPGQLLTHLRGSATVWNCPWKRTRAPA